MSSIDEVIARSRRGVEAFGTRRTFTLSRGRAVRKLREFALPDSGFYILELVQAAIAHGAPSIAIDVDDERLCFWYPDRHLAGEEMASLFDFLFASKDRLEVAHLRGLALGVNALMALSPKQVVIESGDGTTSGTHRVVISAGAERVEVGTASAPLSGTCVLAQGLNRRVLIASGRRCSSERDAMEERCLTAPIPILINSEPLFGYLSQRIPTPFGYCNLVSFDEGDLFGAVGLGEPPLVRLLTFGVWIQSLAVPRVTGVGGAVSFDRLHKTADHAAIVDDEVLAELWDRVRPYAQKALGERSPSLHDVGELGGRPIPTGQLRAWLGQHPRVVLVPHDCTSPHSVRGRRAKAIGAALGAPVLRAPTDCVVAVRRLAGRSVEILLPELESDAEVQLYERPPVAPPTGPFWAEPVAMPPVRALDLARRTEARLGLVAAEGATAAGASKGPQGAASLLSQLLEEAGVVRATLFYPRTVAAPEGGDDPALGTHVAVLASGRLAWQGVVANAYAGQQLVIEVPGVGLGWLQHAIATSNGAVSLAEALAQTLLAEMSSRQQRLETKALTRLLAMGSTGEASCAGADKLVLRAAALAAVPRLRMVGPGVCSLHLAWIGTAPNLLDCKVLRTLGGAAWSLNDLVASMEATDGLYYGVIPTVAAALDGLDLRRVLALDAESERLLLAVFGEAAYIRIDAREVLASASGLACRDLAIGLRPYPAWPLLVEGDVAAISSQAQAAAVDALLARLRALVGDTPAPAPASPSAPEIEACRQALRHLQHYACALLQQLMRRDTRAQLTVSAEAARVLDTPLFATLAGNVLSARQLMPLVGKGRLALTYSGRLGLAGQEEQDIASAAPTLAVSPFVARRLCTLPVTPTLAYDFATAPLTTSGERPRAGGLIARTPVQNRWLEGWLGLTCDAREPPGLLVVEASERHELAEAANPLRLSGYLNVAAGVPRAELERQLLIEMTSARRRLMQQLTHELVTERVAATMRSRAEALVLEYAGEHLTLSATAHGGMRAQVLRPEAQAILELPIFPCGPRRAAAAALVSEFCNYGDRAFGASERRTQLSQVMKEAPPHLRAWILAHLCRARVQRPASRSAAPLPLPVPARPRGVAATIGAAAAEAVCEPASSLSDFELAAALACWLDRLRPDAGGAGDVGRARCAETRVRVARGLAALPSPINRRIVELEEGGVLVLNPKHALVARARANPADPELLAWLLFACYAELNRCLGEVTNEHESELQRCVLAALDRGELGWHPRRQR